VTAANQASCAGVPMVKSSCMLLGRASDDIPGHAGGVA
jgi:hypothetical protein